jgi:hypothetical protein
MPMHKTHEITRLIHDNFWLVMAFAFSQPVLSKLLSERFVGEWKYLRKSLHEFAEIRADRALLEMATQLRVLDDEQGLSEYLKQLANEPFGSVIQGDGTVTALYYRDMTNKIMHASNFEWDFSDAENTKVVCYPNDKDRWQRAEIDLLALAALVGSLMF